MSKSPNLKDWLVLLLEDEPMIALDIATTLEDAGAVVLGPVASEETAMKAIDERLKKGPINGAVLDVNLGDHTCERVAERLTELGVPFVLHTGNWQQTGGLIERIGAPVVAKPASPRKLVEAVIDAAETMEENVK